MKIKSGAVITDNTTLFVKEKNDIIAYQNNEMDRNESVLLMYHSSLYDESSAQYIGAHRTLRDARSE